MGTASCAQWMTMLWLAAAGPTPTAALFSPVDGPARTALEPASETDPVRSVRFAEAVQRAMAFHVEASTSLEDVALARSATAAQRAAISPNFFLQATYTRLDHKRALAGKTLNGRDQINAYAGVVQPLIVPRAWGNLSEARTQERVRWAGHRAARRNAAVGAAYAYLDVVVARRGVEVGRSASRTDRAHLDIARARLQAGLSNRLDALRAEDELAQSEAQLAASWAELSRSQEALGVWLGAGEPLDAADDAELLVPSVAATTPGDRAALAGRADLVLTERELQQARAIRAHSWLDFMPSILATGQLFVQDPPTTTYPRHGWQVQVLATVPVWDGGVRQASMHARAAQERQALLRLDALERTARSEVRAALAVLRHAEARLLQANRSAEAAEASVGLTVRAYRGGTLGNLEVVDAERRNRDAQIRRAQAEDSLRRARLELVVAAGNFPEASAEPGA